MTKTKHKPRKAIDFALQRTSPPDSLTQSQMIARMVASNGSRVYTVQTPESTTLLVELDSRFQNTIWIKRGGYVVVDTTLTPNPENKTRGEIVYVCREEKDWRKQPYWPAQFQPKSTSVDSDEEDSVVGKMPPSDSEEDDY